MNSPATIPSSEIITAASQELNDEEFGRLGEPWYLSATQRALQDLCFDAKWNTRHYDIPVTGSNGIIALQDGCIGLNNIWGFTGNACDVQTAEVIYQKPNMYHNGWQGGFFANDLGGYDPLSYTLSWFNGAPNLNGVFYCGVYEKKLYLSPSCNGFNFVHVSDLGLGMDEWGDNFCVPQWAREAITDKVILLAARKMRGDEGKKDVMERIIREKMGEVSLGNPNGTWNTAVWRWKQMDDKQRQDTVMYTNYFGHLP